MQIQYTLVCNSQAGSKKYMHHSKVFCDNYKDETKNINVRQMQISVLQVPIQRLIKIQASNTVIALFSSVLIFVKFRKKTISSLRKFVISGLPEHKFVTRGPFLRIIIMCLAHLTDVITCLALV